MAPQDAHWQKSLPFAGDTAARPAALATINFEPSDDVHYLHGFLHPGSGGSDFDPSALSSQGNDDYLRTLAALGGVAMRVFFIFILVSSSTSSLACVCCLILCSHFIRPTISVAVLPPHHIADFRLYPDRAPWNVARQIVLAMRARL